MSITMDSICKEMNKYSLKANISGKDNILINEIKFIENSMSSFQADTLYIGKYSDFPENFPDKIQINLLCFADKYVPKKLMSKPNIKIILLNHSHSISSVFNDIQGMLEEARRFTKDKEKLFECVFMDNSLQMLMNKGFEIFGNPVIMTDMSHKIVMRSEVELGDAFWKELNEKPYASTTLHSMINSDSKLVNILSGKVPAIIGCKGLPRKLFSNIFIFHKVVATVGILEICREISEYDIRLISFLSELITLEIQKSKNSFLVKDKMYECFLNDLLEEKAVDDTEIAERLCYIDLVLKKYNYVIIIDSSQYSSGNSGHAILLDALAGDIPECKPLVFNNSVVVLLSRDSILHEWDFEIKQIELLLGKYDLIGGLSLPFINIGDFKKNYKQVLKAIKIGKKINSKKRLFYYKDYFFHHIADFSAKSCDLSMFCHPLVHKLNQIDGKKGTCFVKTLFYYIKNQKSIAASANSLHIHRNTMNYRINQIKSIEEIDWEDFDVVENIYISIKLLEYMESKSFE